MKYKIFRIDGTWKVYTGYMYNENEWTKDNIVFWSNSLADCLAWVKAKEDGLLDII